MSKSPKNGDFLSFLGLFFIFAASPAKTKIYVVFGQFAEFSKNIVKILRCFSNKLVFAVNMLFNQRGFLQDSRTFKKCDFVTPWLQNDIFVRFSQL
jgi:hypothetical protein